jgi:hypothetical protein
VGSQTTKCGLTTATWKAGCADFERAFVFFKHEDSGAGSAYAERMLEL